MFSCADAAIENTPIATLRQTNFIGGSYALRTRQRNRVAAIGQRYEPANHANRRDDSNRNRASQPTLTDVFVIFICVNWRDSRMCTVAPLQQIQPAKPIAQEWRSELRSRRRNAATRSSKAFPSSNTAAARAEVGERGTGSGSLQSSPPEADHGFLSKNI